jgi:hypothetical protein
LTLIGSAAHANLNTICGIGKPSVKWPAGKTVAFFAPDIRPGSGYESAAKIVIAKWNETSALKASIRFGVDGGDVTVVWEDPWEKLARGEEPLLGVVERDNNRKPVRFAAGTTLYQTGGVNGYDCSTYQFKKVMIVMNKTIKWTVSTLSSDQDVYGGKRKSYEAAFMHEVGHALGLSHNSTTYNIMGDSWKHVHTNGNHTTAYPGEYATSLMVQLYGGYTGSPSRDVGVSHYMYLKAEGDYSSHTPTNLFDMNGVELQGGTSRFRNPYIVRRGQRIWAQFTFENLGSGLNDTWETPDIEYVLSTDRYIEPDREISLGHFHVQDPIGTNSGLGRDTPIAQMYPITIPRDITPGQYWIGVILNENRTFAEKDYGNNATYLPIIIFRNSPIDPPEPSPNPSPSPPSCNCPYGCQTNNTFCRVPLQTRTLLNWWQNEPLRQMLLW